MGIDSWTSRSLQKAEMKLQVRDSNEEMTASQIVRCDKSMTSVPRYWNDFSLLKQYVEMLIDDSGAGCDSGPPIDLGGIQQAQSRQLFSQCYWIAYKIETIKSFAFDGSYVPPVVSVYLPTERRGDNLLQLPHRMMTELLTGCEPGIVTCAKVSLIKTNLGILAKPIGLCKVNAWHDHTWHISGVSTVCMALKVFPIFHPKSTPRTALDSQQKARYLKE